MRSTNDVSLEVFVSTSFLSVSVIWSSCEEAFEVAGELSIGKSSGNTPYLRLNARDELLGIRAGN